VVATNVHEVRRVYDRAVKLPGELVAAIARATTLGRESWVKARQDSNFSLFAPHLEELLRLKREVADRIGYADDPYDALLDEYEPGARAADVQQVFAGLRKELVPLVQAISVAPRKPDASILERACPVPAQAAFARGVVAAMGFDFAAGRIDTTTHPFCSGASPLDVRLTTRYDEHYLPMSLFGLMHEAGHGLYEQGLDPAHAHTPMGMSISLGIHESQSRLWENQVGRSRAFWQHWLTPLQQQFPTLADVSLDDWVFAINTVRPSLIRVEADEVTYNLHIMLRMDIERQMVGGQLAVRDVPAAWNEAMQQMLGVTPPNDGQGCLQDIHWSMGILGYFPTYALGNLYSAQIFAASRAALPELDAQIARGELVPLREWLRENVHRHGQRYRAGELCEKVTGAPLSHAPLVDYLNKKYRALYGL
jgi:carboxypeptidase Taq